MTIQNKELKVEDLIKIMVQQMDDMQQDLAALSNGMLIKEDISPEGDKKYGDASKDLFQLFNKHFPHEKGHNPREVFVFMIGVIVNMIEDLKNNTANQLPKPEADPKKNQVDMSKLKPYVSLTGTDLNSVS